MQLVSISFRAASLAASMAVAARGDDHALGEAVARSQGLGLAPAGQDRLGQSPLNPDTHAAGRGQDGCGRRVRVTGFC